MKKKEEVKVENKKNNTVVIAICIALAILFIIVPIFIFSFAMVGIIAMDGDLGFGSTEYKIINKVVVFEDNVANLSDLSGDYNEDTKTYLITGYLKNRDASILELEIDFYDNNNYIIGHKLETFDLTKNKNYKIKIAYDDFDASEVYNFKVRRVLCE